MADDNVVEVGRWLGQIIDSFDFTLPGKDVSLGKDLANAAAQSMIDRAIVNEQAPDGSPWAPNSPSYRDYKRKKYNVVNVGVFTGQMLSLRSMVGEVTIGPDSVEMKYGTGTPATRFSGGEPYNVKNPPTDREKAEDFTLGRHGPPREFYGLDQINAEEIYEVAYEALIDYLEGL